MSDIELVEAVKSGNNASVRALIESGADINQQDKQGWTPLNWASGKGDLEMVELLLQHGSDPFTVGRDLRTPQMIALAAGQADVVKLLRRAEAQVKGGAVSEAERKCCFAYHLKDLRRYAAWTENQTDGPDAGNEPTTDQTADQALADDDVVFLHQDYKVTKSIWPDEDVIFGDVTEGWKDFCDTELKFVVPDSLDLIPPAAPEAAQGTA
jgi:hypothetical protein